MTKIIYPKLSYQLAGLCFQTQKELGRFCREKQYSDKLEELLNESGLDYEREFTLKHLEASSPEGNRVDFLVARKIILEIKAKKFILKEDYYQIQRYLEAVDLELGLIVNFRDSFLKPKRVLNSKFSGYSGSFGDSDRER